MAQEEKEELEREIIKLKKDLGHYLNLYSDLGISEKEKNRVVDQYLDDILKRKEKLKMSN